MKYTNKYKIQKYKWNTNATVHPRHFDRKPMPPSQSLLKKLRIAKEKKPISTKEAADEKHKLRL